jgi:hypothetical protein
MALIVPIDGRKSGSVAGIVFSHNKGGQYVRQRTKPVNPTTVRRTFVRNSMSNNARNWGGLSDAQRTAWKNYAAANPVINRVGMSQTVSGNAMYNRLNQRTADLGLAAISTPPASAGSLGLATLTATNVANVVTFGFTPTPLPAGSRLAIWATGARGPGVDPNFSQARLLGYSASAQATAYAFTLPFTVTAGQVINFYVAVVDASGRTSPVRKLRFTFV